MNGTAAFCEVFLTEARVPAERVIGEVNDGWRVAQTTLRHERGSVAGGGTPGLVTRVRAATVTSTAASARWSNGPAARAEARRSRDPHRSGRRQASWSTSPATTARPAIPIIRQELARYYSAGAGSTAGPCAASPRPARRRLTGADGSIAKLTTSRICQDSRELSYRIAGRPLLLVGADSPFGGELQSVNLASPGTRIGGGTDEIQLNVIGERALGLPGAGRRPDVPYRQLRVGPSAERRRLRPRCTGGHRLPIWLLASLANRNRRRSTVVLGLVEVVLHEGQQRRGGSGPAVGDLVARVRRARPQGPRRGPSRARAPGRP